MVSRVGYPEALSGMQRYVYGSQSPLVVESEKLCQKQEDKVLEGTSSKRRSRGNVDMLLRGEVALVTQDMQKALPSSPLLIRLVFRNPRLQWERHEQGRRTFGRRR